MKIKDLVEEIDHCKSVYGEQFLDWDVFTEQISEQDKEAKKANPQWRWLSDSDEFQYIECAGFWTKFEREQVFTINVNY